MLIALNTLLMECPNISMKCVTLAATNNPLPLIENIFHETSKLGNLLLYFISI